MKSMVGVGPTLMVCAPKLSTTLPMMSQIFVLFFPFQFVCFVENGMVNN